MVLETTHCGLSRCLNYYPGQKNRYSRDIHEIDPQCDLEISWGIESICNASSRRADTASRVDVEVQPDITRYHMIELQINLMNFSAVTIFLARVVVHLVYACTTYPRAKESMHSQAAGCSACKLMMPFYLLGRPPQVATKTHNCCQKNTSIAA